LVAVLLQIRLDAVIHLRRHIGELTGIGHDEPDLYRALRLGRGRHEACRKQRGAGEQKSLHDSPPLSLFLIAVRMPELLRKEKRHGPGPWRATFWTLLARFRDLSAQRQGGFLV